MACSLRKLPPFLLLFISQGVEMPMDSLISWLLWIHREVLHLEIEFFTNLVEELFLWIYRELPHFEMKFFNNLVEELLRFYPTPDLSFKWYVLLFLLLLLVMKLSNFHLRTMLMELYYLTIIYIPSPIHKKLNVSLKAFKAFWGC